MNTTLWVDVGYQFNFTWKFSQFSVSPAQSQMVSPRLYILPSYAYFQPSIQRFVILYFVCFYFNIFKGIHIYNVRIEDEKVVLIFVVMKRNENIYDEWDDFNGRDTRTCWGDSKGEMLQVNYLILLNFDYNFGSVRSLDVK